MFLTCKWLCRPQSIQIIAPIIAIPAFDNKKIKLKIFKVSVRNHCHKDCVVPLVIFIIMVGIGALYIVHIIRKSDIEYGFHLHSASVEFAEDARHRTRSCSSLPQAFDNAADSVKSTLPKGKLFLKKWQVSLFLLCLHFSESFSQQISVTIR